MKNKLKYLLIFSLFIITIPVLSGCAEFSINASINQDNMVEYSYEIIIRDLADDDKNYSEAVSYLEELAAHFAEAGFSSSVEETESELEMTALIEKQCSTRQEAFEELYNYMTNSVSPFIDVDYEYNLNYTYEDYYLKANINLDGMVDDDIYTIYPLIVGDDVDEFLSNLTCSYNISLPQNESTEADIITQKIVSGNIPLDTQTEIFISGKINNNAHTLYEKELLKKWNNNILLLAAGILITILAVIAIIIFSRAIKKNKKGSDELAQ